MMQIMKSSGGMLKEARLRQGLTIEQVEKATKIRAKFIKAIESDDYSQIPSFSYTKGFIKNYSDFLGLNATNILAFYRRQTRDVPKSMLLPQKTGEPLKMTLLQLTPRRFAMLLVVVFCVAFGLYFGFQYQRIQQPPDLKIEKPDNMTIVKENKIEIIGKTDSDATVSINGINILVRDDGKFFDTVQLEKGKNIITVSATSRYGKNISVSRNINYLP